MKNLLKEELNQIKYLFGYERGKVISEQNLLMEDSKTLDLFKSTLPEFWGEDFIEGTTFSEESVSGMVYYIATEPDSTKYYFYYHPNGNPDNKDFKFIQYQHDEDILVADTETQEEPKTQTNTQDQPNNQPVLTTQEAIDAKKRCIDILEDLIGNAEGLGIVKKKESWQASLDQLRATNDNELCSEENKKTVKDNLESAEEQMKDYGWALSKKEKPKCEKLIDELTKYPQYCSTAGSPSNIVQGGSQQDLGKAPQNVVDEIKKTEDDILNSVQNTDKKEALSKELNTNRETKSIGKSKNQSISYDYAQINYKKKTYSDPNVNLRGIAKKIDKQDDDGTWYTIVGTV